EVAQLLGGISGQRLSATDSRAIMLIHKSLESISADQTSLTHKIPCHDAQRSDLTVADLRSALYSCFDEIGNNLEFEGKRVSRVSAFDLMTQMGESARRKALFMAFVPLWKTLNGS